jgi:hypothetical protein
MNLVKGCIEGLALGVAVASATFWLQATRINPPWAATDTMEGRPAPDVLQQLRRQSELNAKAALFSGISAILQWIALACLSRIEKSQFLTDRNVTRRWAGRTIRH